MTTTILGPRREGIARVAAVLDFIFGLLYAILAIRLILVLLGARASAGFVRFIVDITAPFYAPFRGIVASGTVDAHRIAWPIVIAIVVYMIVHAILRALLRFADKA